MKIIKLLSILFFLVLFNNVYGQVKGLSYTIAPMAEYQWAGENSGLENGYLGGLQLGLAFGQNVELRASYQTSFNVTDNLANFNYAFTDAQIENYTKREVELTRYMGNIRLNLSRGNLVPYLTLGTGVQNMSRDTFSLGKQIMVEGGLGLNFTAGDRYSIGVQAVNSRYRYNATNRLLSADERNDFDISEDDFMEDYVSNYALRASLIVYIGGRRPSQETDIDAAYWDNFTNGFTGISVPIEPTIHYINFSETLPYTDTYLAGVSAGLDFGPLVGVRGFFSQAFAQDEFQSFDGLYVYGGEGKFKLNEGKGFTPYVTIGGGNIDIREGYSIAVDEAFEDTPFATGGFGMEIPFSKYFKIAGYAKSMLTTSEDLEEINNPDRINSSWNYGVSANFIIGRNKKNIPVVKESTMEEYLLAEKQDSEKARENLKKEYEAKIETLEKQKEQAIQERDSKSMKEIDEQTAIANKIIEGLEQDQRFDDQNRNNGNNGNGNNGNRNNGNDYNGNNMMNSGSLIKMSPSEFQLLMEGILERQNSNNNSQNPMQMYPPQGYYQQPMQQQQPQQQNPGMGVEEKIKLNNSEQQIKGLSETMLRVELAIADLKEMQEEAEDDNEELAEKFEEAVDKIENRYDEIELKLLANNRKIEALQSNQKNFEQAVMNGDASVAYEPLDVTNLQNEIAQLKREMAAMKKLEVERRSNVNMGSNNLPTSSTTTTSNEDLVTLSEDFDTETKMANIFRYNGMSAFVGLGVGSNSTFNLGYRLYYQYKDTKFNFVPETFFGFGSPTNFGIMANGIYDLGNMTKNSGWDPYAGFGLGLMKAGDAENLDKLSGTFNLIAGTTIDVANGNLFVDFTTRNFFKYNQLAIGYKLPF